MSDLGYIDEDGYLYLVGRRDDVINVGGLKVAPTEVEDIALHHPAIEECVCVPFDQAGYGKSIKMLVKVKKGEAFAPDDIAAFLNERLENYKVPKVFEEVMEIPKTFNGKIDRRKIIRMYSNMN